MESSMSRGHGVLAVAMAAANTRYEPRYTLLPKRLADPFPERKIGR